MIDLGADKVGMLGSQHFDEDGRMVIEFDGREVARVNPMEAVGLVLLLQEAIKEFGFDDVEPTRIDLTEAGMVQ